MATTEFEIGTSVSGLQYLEDLGVAIPRWEYRDWARAVELGDGTVRGHGSPAAVWRWRYLTLAQRAALKTYCSGKSASVVIRTRNNSHSYANYNAVMVWPDAEEWDGSRVIDFEIIFKQLVAA